MSETSLQPRIIRSSTAFFLSAILFGWLVLMLAVTGIFFTPVIALILSSIVLANVILWKKGLILLPPKKLLVILFPFILIAVVVSLTATPTIFSGRDQGSLSEAAIRLSKNHQLPFHTPASQQFFKIYGPGKALNFPGFYYTQEGELSTQFPLGYIAWVGAFFSLGGLTGLMVANAILFSLFLTAFSRLTQELISRKLAILSLLFVISSFAFSWFFKFTLSETMALALLWIGISELITFIRTMNPYSLASLFLSLGLLVFTRIEGFVFLAVTIVILLSLSTTRIYIRKHQDWCIFLPTALLVTFFLIASRYLIPFYREMGRVLGATLKSTEITPANIASSLPLGSILFHYGLLTFLIFGSTSIIIAIHKKNWFRLVPLLIVAPTFIYLIEPHISNDHPWMLRRFIFSILPAGIFYTILLIQQISSVNFPIFARRFLALTVILISIGFCLPATSRYILHTENPGLWNQAIAFGEKFSPRDLVLVDRSATGDGWSMITGPLSSLQDMETVYFFNPEDLNKLDLDRFNQVYLVVAEVETQRYTESMISNRLSAEDQFTFDTYRLKLTSNNTRFAFPAYQQSTTKNTIFSVSK